ncbi:MBL fold metallo-hydrolase [Candidatus Lokiarchaeum ossiferum]|uniref:MBL fold metallo-hydrolase n=1 Tax=Candidatus Lokiarchaeum ossiferum TaxID=2951803 RepID=UPI00352FB381
MSKAIEFDSPYFTIRKLHEGIYATLGLKDDSYESNAGFFDLGNHVIVFDTFLNYSAAIDLKRAAEEITGKQVSMVINSHYHTDHVIGNNLFDQSVPLISTQATYDITKEQTMKSVREIKALDQKEVDDLEAQLETETDETKRNNIKNELNFITRMRNPEFEVRLPDMIVKKELIIYGTKRTVHLTNVGAAHTDGDLVAYFPKEKICFMGDLLFSDCFAWIGSGKPELLNEVLKTYMDKDIDIYVSGHGPLSTKDDLSIQVDYVTELIEIIKKRIETKTEDTPISKSEFKTKIQNWDGVCYEWNINFLKEYLKQ